MYLRFVHTIDCDAASFVSSVLAISLCLDREDGTLPRGQLGLGGVQVGVGGSLV